MSFVGPRSSPRGGSSLVALLTAFLFGLAI
jgi:hypothetical protein